MAASWPRALRTSGQLALELGQDILPGIARVDVGAVTQVRWHAGTIQNHLSSEDSVQ